MKNKSRFVWQKGHLVIESANLDDEDNSLLSQMLDDDEDDDKKETAAKIKKVLQKILKHGSHDQSSHGNRGGLPANEATNFGARDYSERVAAVEKALLDNFTSEEAERYDATIKSWTGTPESRRGMTLEAAISELFGGKPGKFDNAGEVMMMLEERERKHRKDENLEYDGMEELEKTKAMAKKVYDHTQSILESKYPNGAIRLYRGFIAKNGTVEEGEVDLEFDAVSSFSGSREIAETFASDERSSSHQSFIAEIEVPIEHVFLTPHSSTELLEMEESEFLVMNMGTKLKARVKEFVEDDND